MLEFIAEIGWNFMGDNELAAKMIRAAKSAGATTAKFQYWNPDKLKDGPWFSDGRIDIYREAALSDQKIKTLIEECERNEIEFLISAFNVEDAKYLSDLGVKHIKIPSHEVSNVELHEFSAREFDKCYVSLGAGSWKELSTAIEIYNRLSENWVGMHCVSSYPCPANKVNLQKIQQLGKSVEVLGFSDHTESTMAPALALCLGATVFEKHFTSDKALPGRDNKFALNQSEFSQMVSNTLEAENMLTFLGLDAIDIEADTIANYRGRWG
jgi:N,N'-diacetyllegionaminate synthase